MISHDITCYHVFSDFQRRCKRRRHSIRFPIDSNRGKTFLWVPDMSHNETFLKFARDFNTPANDADSFGPSLPTATCISTVVILWLNR